MGLPAGCPAGIRAPPVSVCIARPPGSVVPGHGMQVALCPPARGRGRRPSEVPPAVSSADFVPPTVLLRRCTCR